MTDDGCITFFYEVMGYVFASDGDGCGITGFETFCCGFGIVDLNVYLSLEIAHLREYRFPDETFAKVFFDFKLPCCLFGIVGSTVSDLVWARGGTWVDGYC